MIRQVVGENGRSIDLFFGEEFFLRIDKRLFAKIDIAAWVVDSAEEFFLKFFEVERKIAWNWALKRLTIRPMHSNMLKEKMHDRYITEATIAETVEKLTEYGFLCDAAFIENFVQRRLAQGKSRQQIYMLAKSASLPLQEIEAVFSCTEMQALVQPGLLRLIEKKYSVLLRSERGPARQKALAALIRRGFSHRVIVETLKLYSDILEK